MPIRKWPSATALIALLIVYGGCTKGVSQPELELDPYKEEVACAEGVSVVDDELWMCGKITPDIAAQVVGMGSAVRSLNVVSSGGDSSAAARIAEFLDQEGATLRISGECFSACAHFLFLPVDRVEVEEGALIAFHHAATTLVMRAYKFLADGPLKDKVVADAQAQTLFYRTQGLDPRWLIEPDFRTGPVCVHLGIVQDPNYPIVSYENKFDLWVPPVAQLAAVNPMRKHFSVKAGYSEARAVAYYKARFKNTNAPSFLLQDWNGFQVSMSDGKLFRMLPICGQASAMDEDGATRKLDADQQGSHDR